MGNSEASRRDNCVENGAGGRQPGGLLPRSELWR